MDWLRISAVVTVTPLLAAAACTGGGEVSSPMSTPNTRTVATSPVVAGTMKARKAF